MSPHLVPLKPALYADCSCPKCGQGGPEPLGTVFPGVHVLGEYRCRACGYAFYRDLPVGFAVDNAVSIGKEEDKMGIRTSNTTDVVELAMLFAALEARGPRRNGGNLRRSG